MQYQRVAKKYYKCFDYIPVSGILTIVDNNNHYEWSNPLQSTTPPSSKYHTTLFKVAHHPLQSTSVWNFDHC